MKNVLISTLTALVMALTVSSTAIAGNGKSPSGQNIVDIALSDPDNFSILVDLVLFAELDGVLAEEGQFTVFAPTNQAFADLIAALTTALGEDATNALLSDKAFITNVLLYHVTDGRRFSNSLVNRNSPKMVEMLNGDYVVVNSNATITDGSALTADSTIDTSDPGTSFNISATNGVIHVIDAVLVP
jgi:uncharacterized surface protein with fasciclin (FAS1) repeats